MYYAVTQGRARGLDRLNLRDRSTYGIDWMVLDATSARDAVRQWQTFKAGVHPFQGDLELGAARYRANAPEYQAAREAESEIVSSDIEGTLQEVDERRRELDQLRGRLEDVRKALLGSSRRGGGGGRARRKSRAGPPRASAPARRRRAA
jgi:hypothetical protein